MNDDFKCWTISNHHGLGCTWALYSGKTGFIRWFDTQQEAWDYVMVILRRHREVDGNWTPQ